MKNLYKLLVSTLFIATFGFATVTVDGYAYLENQSDHSGIQVLFERIAPSSLLDSTTTATDGSYSIELEDGIYDVTYSKDGYFFQSLSGQILYNNTTLNDITLYNYIQFNIIYVPENFETIQGAINYASDGDTILVQPGTYVENINYNGKNLVIGSLFLTTEDTSHISQTIIDGNESGSVVTFENGEDSTVVLTGFTIINGDATENYSRGGGINCYNSSPRLENLSIRGNSAQRGGGISCYNSSPRIVNVEVSGNSTHGSGSNSGGGGVYCYYNSSPEMVNVLINNNSSADFGGGILSSLASSPNLANVTICNNLANSSGGGMYIGEGNPILKNVTICNNSSNWGGAGIDDWSSGSSLTNVIVSGNDGEYGILMHSGEPTISYSNFYNNGTVNIINSEWIGVNITTNANGDSCDVYYNIQKDPEFVDIDNNVYHLQNWSGLIGAGTTTNAPTTDIEGNPRPNPSGTNPDIGAYENPYGVPQYMPVVLNVPADYSTIQAALTAANATDTVLVQPGTYTENIIWPETNGIKLISAGDSSNTIIDGGGVSSVIYMNPQTATIDTTTLIQGFKITNGGNVSNGGGLFINNCGPMISNVLIQLNQSSESGGGIYIKLVNVNGTINHTGIIKDSHIITNTSVLGGGLRQQGGTLIVNNVKFNDNVASSLGGGLFVAYSSPVTEIYSSSFTGNSASSGGGMSIISSNSFITCNNTKFIDNNGSSKGGGIHLEDPVVMNFNGLEIIGNTGGEGGGIHLNGVQGSFKNTIVAKNSANMGGGLYIRNMGNGIDAENLKIVENLATDKGGGAYLFYCKINFDTTSIVNNTANTGGAIFVPEGTESVITNTTIYGNSSQGINGLHLDPTNVSNSQPFSITVQSSNINNGNYGVKNDSQDMVTATNNYWGHSSGPYHPTQNPSGQGDG